MTLFVCVVLLQAPKPLPITLTVQARPCTTGEELGTDGRCRQCSAGTYGRNGQCMQCKPGASCPGGALMLPQEGWWHSTPASDVFKPCLQAQACRCAQHRSQAAIRKSNPRMQPESATNIPSTCVACGAVLQCTAAECSGKRRRC